MSLEPDFPSSFERLDYIVDMLEQLRLLAAGSGDRLDAALAAAADAALAERARRAQPPRRTA